MLPVLLALAASAPGQASGQDADRIARLIFHNECASRPACLTSWNPGEEFASLGIGHFIWYPVGTPPTDRRFTESFPQLLAYLRGRGVVLPGWLASASGCPWPDRGRFLAAQDSVRMQQLRSLLVSTMGQQAGFIRQRLAQALPDMLGAVPKAQRRHIENQFRRVAASPTGYYALTDYVNFKGEGTNPSERYAGKGWGMLQVLAGMQGEQPGLDAIEAFVGSADALLTRRVAHAPEGRNEARWLPGWRKRLQSYVAEARRSLATGGNESASP